MEPRRASRGKIVPFTRGFPAGGSMVENPNVTREDCIEFLGRLGPVSDSFLALLQIPERLIFSQGESFRSFSVPGNKGLQRLASSFALGQPVPRDFPDFGIHVGSVGGNLFCTFVDRWRKVIVYGSVKNAQAGEGSWDMFQKNVEAAIAEVKKQESRGEKFDFVICRGGSMKLL
ncbi:MAG: hypothetical protein AB1324_01515 [Candidatus Micrarchaeota archaeon]